MKRVRQPVADVRVDRPALRPLEHRPEHRQSLLSLLARIAPAEARGIPAAVAARTMTAATAFRRNLAQPDAKSVTYSPDTGHVIKLAKLRHALALRMNWLGVDALDQLEGLEIAHLPFSHSIDSKEPSERRLG
jgi:hypothetical protein